MKKTSSGLDYPPYLSSGFDVEEPPSPLAHRHPHPLSPLGQPQQRHPQQHAGHQQPHQSVQQPAHQHSRAGKLFSWLPQLNVAGKESFAFTRKALTSGIIYSISSAALTLFNKKVLVAYEFHAVHSLLCFHCILAAGLVRLCSATRLAPRVEPLTAEVLRVWLPLNVLFVGMLATNFYALQLVGVAMVSVLKNLSNLFILVGDFVLFGRAYNWQCWACLLLMGASAFAGGATDLHFSALGYAWQMVNNGFTAAYALHLSSVTERLSGLAITTSGRSGSDAGGGAPAALTAASAATALPGAGGAAPPAAGPGPGASVTERTSRKRSELSMTYYNNLLSVPFTLALAIVHQEHLHLLSSPALRDPSFQLFSIAGGLLGFALSYSSIQFVSLTSATIYSLVGSMNKVVVTIAGYHMFGEVSEPLNTLSVAVGLAAGTLLPFVKMRAATPPPGVASAAGAAGAAGAVVRSRSINASS